MLINGQDIPTVKLKPLRERQISQRARNRIAASIEAVGLIEPLVVFPEKDNFVILNGYVRYTILLEMGVETIPCIIWKEKEAFTGNRMVNRLSPIQEVRMIKQSLEELDEKTIAKALAISQIGHRLNGSLLKQVSARVAAAYDTGKITKACANQLTFVKPGRQDEILGLMENYNDFTLAFAQTWILKTPVAQRAKKSNALKSPWDRSEKRKTDLLKNLKDAQEKHDFYSALYRQYSINLLKLVIYARTLISNERVAAYLEQAHGEIFTTFQEIIMKAEG